MKIICIIPARLGSVRIKKKNLIDFKGKPLIHWTLKQSIRIPQINKIILSSDSKKLIKFSKSISQNILFNIRPKSLSKSSSKTESVIKYLVEKYTISSKDYILILQPTSPLRQDKDIKNIIQILKKKKLKTLHSVTTKHKKTEIFSSSFIHFIKKRKIIDTSLKYSYNGAIYLFSASYFKKKNTIYEKKPNIYIMNKKHSLDIDDYIDLKGYSNLKISTNT